MEHFGDQQKNYKDNQDKEEGVKDIPPQYRGMSSEALQEIWANPENIPILVNESLDDRRAEIDRRQAVVDKLRDLEKRFDVTANPKPEEAALVDRMKQISSSIYFSRRGHLNDDMFLASKGFVENEDGTGYSYEKVDGNVGRIFDAHGIDKGDQLESLVQLLSKGVDANRTFFLLHLKYLMM